MIENSDVDSDEHLDESQDFIEGEDIKNEQNELYEMRSDSVFDVIKKDGVIALYSPPNSLELFYLCKVKEFGQLIKSYYPQRLKINQVPVL